MFMYLKYVFFLVLLVFMVNCKSDMKHADAKSVDLAKQHELQTAMRKLWEDHITWTRLYLVSALAGLPDATPVSARLLQNQADIGDAMRPYYGDTAADQLTALLKDHIGIAVEVVDAAKAGHKTKLNASVDKWNTNADDIGAFLGKANPNNWPTDEMKAMMREHLTFIIDMVNARLEKNWTADVTSYDKYHNHILEMVADPLSDGIVKQFPDKF